MARLTRLASMLTRDRESAHDLVQETLVRVGCAWNRIDRDGSPSGYATTTMSRLAWRQSARSRTEWTLLNRHAPTETAPDDFSRVDDAMSLRLPCTSSVRASEPSLSCVSTPTCPKQRWP